jgi:stringent starvation protein B
MTQKEKTITEVRQALEKALEDQEVFIHLNGGVEDVSLPEQLAGNPNVTLKISHYYRGPLTISENEVHADLLFPEGPHTCIVPIEHIWGITQMSGESRFWPEHAPREILEQMVRGVAAEEGTEERSESKETTHSRSPAKREEDSKQKTSFTRIDNPEKESSSKPSLSLKPSPSLKRIK